MLPEVNLTGVYSFHQIVKMSCFVDSLKKETCSKWNIVKYARYIGTPENRSKLDQDWKVVVSSPSNQVHFCVTESKHLVVIFGQHLLVSN